MIASVEQLAANMQRLKEVYATQPIAIHMLADARGKSTIETIFYLAHQDDVANTSRCAGNVEERDKALAALDADPVLGSLSQLRLPQSSSWIWRMILHACQLTSCCRKAQLPISRRSSVTIPFTAVMVVY